MALKEGIVIVEEVLEGIPQHETLWRGTTTGILAGLYAKLGEIERSEELFQTSLIQLRDIHAVGACRQVVQLWMHFAKRYRSAFIKEFVEMDFADV